MIILSLDLHIKKLKYLIDSKILDIESLIKDKSFSITKTPLYTLIAGICVQVVNCKETTENKLIDDFIKINRNFIVHNEIDGKKNLNKTVYNFLKIIDSECFIGEDFNPFEELVNLYNYKREDPFSWN